MPATPDAQATLYAPLPGSHPIKPKLRTITATSSAAVPTLSNQQPSACKPAKTVIKPDPIVPVPRESWSTVELEGKYPCYSLMQPRGDALAHAAAPLLQQYAKNGCPVNTGRNWSRDEITTTAEHGPHRCALAPDAI